MHGVKYMDEKKSERLSELRFQLVKEMFEIDPRLRERVRNYLMSGKQKNPYAWLSIKIPEERLAKMTPDELWENGYCPNCRVKQTLTADEPPFRYCPKCGAVG